MFWLLRDIAGVWIIFLNTKRASIKALQTKEVS
jgi:hypothetical protein